MTEKQQTVPVTGKVAYSVTEACALLGISRTDGYRKVKSGEIPSRGIGQRILIPASWVHSFQEVAAS